MKPILETASAVHPALQGVFEPGWDHSTDILVVLGKSDPEFFSALVDVGQRRVIVMRAKNSVEPLPPEPFPLASTPLELFQSILKFSGENPTHAAIRRQPGIELTREYLDELIQALRGAISTFGLFRRTIEMHAPQWALQGIENLPSVASFPSLEALKGAFEGVPCVIVSPGPSLDKNIELLKELNGRALVMTCSHALRAIEEAGARADIVAVSDPKFTGRHFKGSTSLSSSTLLLDAVCDPRNYEIPSARKFVFASHESVDPWVFGAMGESASLESGGSVACVELSTARLMGCNPIVMMGQDLALTEGRYYAKLSIDGMAYVEPTQDGKAFELIRPHFHEVNDELTVTRHKEEEMMTVPAWGGGTVQTSSSLYTFLQWFGAAANSMEERVFNCTEGGAFIEGMEHIPLKQFLEAEELPAVDIDSILAERAATADIDARRVMMIHAIEEMLERLGTCANEARDCGRLASLALKDAKALEELSRSEKKLSEAIGPLPALSMLAQARIREAQTRAEKAKTLDVNLDAAKDLFRVVIEASDQLKQPLSDALRMMKARIIHDHAD